MVYRPDSLNSMVSYKLVWAMHATLVLSYLVALCVHVADLRQLPAMGSFDCAG